MLADKCEQCDTIVIAVNGDDKWCCRCGAKLQGNYVKVSATLDEDGNLVDLQEVNKDDSA